MRLDNIARNIKDKAKGDFIFQIKRQEERFITPVIIKRGKKPVIKKPITKNKKVFLFTIFLKFFNLLSPSFSNIKEKIVTFDFSLAHLNFIQILIIHKIDGDCATYFFDFVSKNTYIIRILNINNK